MSSSSSTQQPTSTFYHQLDQSDLDELLGGHHSNSSSPSSSSTQQLEQPQNQQQQHLPLHRQANSVSSPTRQKNNDSTTSFPVSASDKNQKPANTIRAGSNNHDNNLAESLIIMHHNSNNNNNLTSPSGRASDASSDSSQRAPILKEGAPSQSYDAAAAGGGTSLLLPSSSSPSSSTASAGPSYAKRLVLAVVNPLSGERSAAEGLCRSLTAMLGEDRVLKLSSAVFRDSTPIAIKLAEGARRVLAAHPNDGGDSSSTSSSAFDGSTSGRRMSVLVAGGDGTVSFIIGVLENLVNDPQSGLKGVAPAIMVIPMGTGNDLSNALGYGLGFTTNKCCCCCVCCPNDVECIVKTGLSAPVVPFDRWNATVYRVDNKSANTVARTAHSMSTNPATMIQQKLAKTHRTNDFAANTAASGCYDSVEEWKRSISAQIANTNADDNNNNNNNNSNDADDDFSSVSLQTRNKLGKENQNQNPPMQQQQQQQQQRQQQQDQINLSPLTSFDFNNYFSFGLDAAIATDFDDKRRKYPSCHTYRTLNKMWYGYHGLAMAVSATPFSNGIVSVACDRNEVALSKSQDGCRAFVISNIASYSGGVDLWNVKSNLSAKQTASNSGATRDVTYHPASVCDGMLEAVSIGGFFHMGFLRVGMGGDKIAQGSHMTFALGDFVGENKLRGKTLAFQVDGEPAGVFTYDPGCLVVDVKLRSRVYFHKVNS